MKKTIVIFTLLASLFASAFGNSSLKEITLATGGESSYSIVVAPEKISIPSERFAAVELREYLLKITGVNFPVVEEGKNTGPGIYLGATARAKNAGIITDNLGREEWVIQTEGQDLIISGGRTRGTLYGVYEFLDKCGGCRWVSLDLETVPRHDLFNIPGNLRISGKPAFSYRLASLYPGKCGNAALYQVRNRFNVGKSIDKPEYGFSEQFGRPGFCHTFTAYQEDWTDVKPEYYALFDGKRQPRGEGHSAAQLCLTHPEVREKVYQTLLGFIKADRKEADERGAPYPTRYDISHNDHMRYCQCPTCMAIAEREGSYSGTNIDFINSLAVRLKKDYPDLTISTFAYTYTAALPKTIRPLDNVEIRVALLDKEYKGEAGIADVLRPLTHPANSEAKELIDRWSVVTRGNLLNWGYAQLFRAPYRYPYESSNKIAADLEYLHSLGSTYASFEHYSLDMSFSWLGKWLFAQKALDPKRDTRALVGDFMTGYFGPAAGVMQKYYDYLVKESKASSQPLGSTPPPQIPYLTAEFFQAVNVYLDEAEKLCAGAGHEKYLRNVRFERVPVDSGTLYLWHQFAGKLGFENQDAVIDRYQVNKSALHELFPTGSASHLLRGTAVEGEITALKIPIPAEFKNRNPSIRYPSGLSGNKPVADPLTASGLALRMGGGKDGLHTLPFRARIHDSAHEHTFPMIRLDTFPSDGAYHWYHLGTNPLSATCGFWSNMGLWIPMGWGATPPPNNELDVYVSLKFTGPTYVPGSTDPDEVLLEGVLVAPPLASEDKEDKQP